MLDKKTRRKVMWRSTFLQGSWNYERMQNGGWCFAMIPALKKLYTKKEEQADALHRNLEFFNTHPYVVSPILGVALAQEEQRAQGKAVSQDVKVGMMGPLAGVADPVFWFTARPLLGALGASLAMEGSILGPLVFFIGWNLMRIGFMWKSQEMGYEKGEHISDDLAGGLLQKATQMAGVVGMFAMGALVQRYVSIDIPLIQDQLDGLLPGLLGLVATFICMKALKKNVSLIVLILAMFIIGVAIGLL
ncbi:PTS system mannose/fructose/sorbose family transporter subunit IID [Absicoccus porci]|jgi:PTS system mannose-specific IID component|uniref:PTS system mannose/fructose/sorbose family transporter subunit IID n=1 Tax=Absicoccus porci TaxID=2486576 RepID=UPI001567D388|nr:PTS system mannose/fructose/sorbose family transporter subunit IID [Absicoccus porci]MDD6460857.1 PTS system mannose/fructose/sorbose family transporter subunit IID [Absicoccus porci]